jgi:modulator of FtsH protease
MNKYIKGYKIGYDSLLVNKVIRNTYILLSFILLFSSLTAWFSVVMHAKSIGFLSIFIYFGLYYLVNLFKNSVYGIVFLFILTGFMGYTLGPILNSILYKFINGQEIIILSFFLTSCLFILLSIYAIFTKKNFNYLGGFLFVTLSLIILLMIVNVFYSTLFINILVSFFIILLSCGYILYETSLLINGGERNYIIATINLYLDFFNLFVSLLRLLGIFIGKRD